MESEKSASSQKIDFWLGMYLWAFGERSSKSLRAKTMIFGLESLFRKAAVILHNQKNLNTLYYVTYIIYSEKNALFHKSSKILV